MTDIVLDKSTIKRLAKDVKELLKHPLHDHGIYYVHNNDNILKGQALFIGPEDTPYTNGYYLFEFEFPPTYPQMPPKVIYCTNDGVTRFNPNLYRNGKVCLSMLNTWRGDQWSSCNTISSVLLNICTVFNNKPLLNEPGKNENDEEFDDYNKILTYKNIEVAIGNILENDIAEKQFPALYEIIIDNFKKNYAKISSLVNNNIEYNDEIVNMKFFNMITKLSYTTQEKRLKKIMKKINKKGNQKI
tara:strand:+ start:1047 stop:1778 length:732 start_codon:yes stop_codon:yes gene_type:complete